LIDLATDHFAVEIQSVLDVRDDNQLPKGAGAGPAFNRSILILTPERALKFTATSQERHYVWLTALSFLSHSPLGFGDLTALPLIPQQEYLAPQTLGGSLRRNPIRDSIRVAKGRDPLGGRAGQRSFTTDGVIPQYRADREALYQPHEPIYATISDAADPPTVPRYHSHFRHRSNTGPRLPPTSFRNFSNHSHTNAPAVQPPSSTYSMTTASDIYSPSLYSGYQPTSNGFTSTKSSFSRRRGSEASASIANSHTTNPAPANGYFDHHNTAPTMRMEAFIGEEGGPRARGSYRTRKGRKKDMGYWGVGDTVASPTTMMMPAVELPDEVVEMRSNSRSPNVNGNGNGNGHPGMDTGVQIDALSIMSQENFNGKRHVIEEDLEFESAHGNHFRGF
jgi:Meiotic cell cortex C-terminal pleckstrin homology